MRWQPGCGTRCAAARPGIALCLVGSIRDSRAGVEGISEPILQVARMTDRINLLNLTPAEARARLAAAMAELGQPRYRVEQVLRRLWVRPLRRSRR